MKRVFYEWALLEKRGHGRGTLDYAPELNYIWYSMGRAKSESTMEIKYSKYKWALLLFNQFKVWSCFTFPSDVIIINGPRWKMGEIFFMNNCPGKFPQENYYRFHLYASLNGEALRKLSKILREIILMFFSKVSRSEKRFFFHSSKSSLLSTL